MKRLPLGTNVFQFTKAVRAVLLGTIITVGQAMAAEKPGTTPPIDSVSVYWVGHSLMNTPAETKQGPVDLMSLVASFANARNLKHKAFDHTFTGVPLAAQWRGKPYAYDRDASSMVPKREAFERNAGEYDTLVLTELLPLQAVFKYEFSEYYLRKFYCTIKNANPAARVFLYETWTNGQGTSPHGGYPSIEYFDWRAEMVKDRERWESLAKAALEPKVKSPGWLSRFSMHSKSDGGCEPGDPILIVPLGQAMIALFDRMKNPRPQDNFAWPGGEKLTFVDLFANPYTNIPASWPLKTGETTEKPELTPRDPSKPVDDAHPALPTIYLSALVHFATLYRQSPEGLPYPDEIGEPLAKTLQCIAWETVTTTSLTGVTANAGCAAS